jgi:CRISPR/Cas system-associated protein Cas5 (RAMP superfamily)
LNEHLLAHKVSVLILKMDNPYLLIFATALIGALVAGFAALTGAYLRKKKA